MQHEQDSRHFSGEMNNLRLSIVTVTRDDAAGLARTLASARPLRAVGAEHLVIDGGTTPEATRQIAAQEGGGAVVIARPPCGIADAFNAGLGAATGEWVWFLNGGDRIDPGLNPEVLERLLAETKADVLIGGVTYEGEPGPRPAMPPGKRWPPLRSWIPHPSTLVRRRLFGQFGNFDPRYSIAMDYEWFLRVLCRGTSVEVHSAPFAVFAGGGISQQPDSFAKIVREQNDAIRRHHRRLWRLSPYVLYRLMRAALSARLDSSST